MRLFPLLALGVALCFSTASAADEAAEIEFWQSAKDSGSVSELEAYLSAYPNGKFAPLARIRLKGLKSGNPSDATSPVSEEPAQPVSDPREKTLEITLDAWPHKPDIARIGIIISPVTEGLAELFEVEPPRGVLVVGVTEGTPAQEKGIGPGTLILSLEDIPIRDSLTLAKEVAQRRPGEAVSIKVLKVSKTKDTFEQLLRAGAAEGNADAMVRLAWGLDAGTFAPKDADEAVRWYKKAAALGDKQAIERLQKLGVTGIEPAEGDAEPGPSDLSDDIGDLD